MICTCTMNPSLDYFMEFDQPVKAGAYNRSRKEYYEAGGKGINVSIVLSNLQIPTRALGFMGGFNKDFFITLLEKYSFIQPSFTYTEGHTRVNVKLADGQKETDLNGEGPLISKDDMERLMAKTARLYKGDYFVLAGYSQSYLESDVRTMLKRMMNDGVKVVLDTRPSITKSALRDHPFLIKTTQEELEEQAEAALTEAEIIDHMKGLQKAGAVNVMVLTNEGKDALLACSEGIYKGLLVRRRKPVSMVGTGDALVGGFLMNCLRSAGTVESFRYGCCCAAATAYVRGFADRAMADELAEKFTVTCLEKGTSKA